MIDAQTAAKEAEAAVDDIVTKVVSGIESTIQNRILSNQFHYNCCLFAVMTPAVFEKVVAHFQTLGYKMESVFDGSQLDHVRISWYPPKPKISFLQRLFG